MDVCCECCVLSGRGLCVGLITRPEESYRLWCVVECDLETSSMRPWAALGPSAKSNKKVLYVINSTQLIGKKNAFCLQQTATCFGCYTKDIIRINQYKTLRKHLASHTNIKTLSKLLPDKQSRQMTGIDAHFRTRDLPNTE